MIAALYVEENGVYAGLEGVEVWGVTRDARRYAGPWPAVAHLPCQRYGQYWSGGPSARVRRVKGDDGGCFAAALAAVRRWGGVLEHPEASHAWPMFGLNDPPWCGGWVVADWEGGWTCCVAQGHYGHPGRKMTWLYAHGVSLPELTWGPSPSGIPDRGGFHSATERRRAIKTGVCQRLSSRQRQATPLPFRELLLGIARTARPPTAPAAPATQEVRA